MSSRGSGHQSTHEYARGVVDALRETMANDGHLVDPMSGRPIPDDQYGQTSFAVAAVRVAERVPGNAAELKDASIAALRWYLAGGTASRGHAEFNSFALLELVAHLDRTGTEFAVSTDRLYDALAFSARPDSREGNNWLLLRGLCHARLAALGRGASHELWYRRIRRLVGRWVLGDGVVADEPRLPLRRVKTPLTYHAKLATLCVRLGILRDDPVLLEWGKHGFRALDEVSLPTGEALYFGRSENTVFGYATALDGVSRLEQALDSTGDCPPWVQPLKRRLAQYLVTHFDTDPPNCQPSHRDAHVDTYVIDGVYAAYAAMLLLGIPDISVPEAGGARGSAAPSTDDGSRARDDGFGEGAARLERSALCRITGRRSALGTATAGQLSRTRGVLDPRYAGLVPHSFVVDDRPVCPGTPADFLSLGRLPLVPTVTHGGTDYAPTTWARDSARTAGQVTTFRGRANWHPVGTPIASPDDSVADGANGEDRPIGERARRFVIDSVKATARKAKVDLVLNERSARPVSLPLAGWRALHYLREADALVLQTLIRADEPVELAPTSIVVADAYASDRYLDRHEATDGAVKIRSTVTDRATARWICPAPRQISRYWSTVVIDPLDRVSSATTTTNGSTGLETALSMRADETNVVRLSTDPSRET